MSLNINFKPCCANCTNRKSYLDESGNKVYYNNDSINMGVETKIGCEHEKVCMEFNIIKKVDISEKAKYTKDDFSMVDQLFKIEGLSAAEARQICNDSESTVFACGIISVASLFALVKTITNSRVDVICKPIYKDYGWHGGINIHYSCDVCSYDEYTVQVMEKPIRL